MNHMGKRVIHYAGNSVEIEYNDPQADKILDTIVYSISSPGASNPFTSFRIDITRKPDLLFSLFQEGTLIYKSKNEVDFSEMLMSKICHGLAMDSKNGMLFHASGLGRNGKGILVPGGIGFGKSTFTTWMISQGCDYLSDEFVYFPWESDTMISFARPIHLKKPSREVLSSLIEYDSDTNLVKVGTHSDLINPLLLNAENKYSQPPVKIILFPRYETGAELDWRLLSSAETGLELMKFLINARNLPDHGFKEIARLARPFRGIKFTYSSFEQIEKNIIEILERI
ncbi:MAG: hypothetical protein Q7U53_02105 [Anaerolineaceae bacterium]|nr:hypothetical protein [Anaerolineaceae bacterium]